MLESPKDQNTRLIEQLDFSENVRAIILGSILGDGSLYKSKGAKNANFAFRHSSVQSEYFY